MSSPTAASLSSFMGVSSEFKASAPSGPEAALPLGQQQSDCLRAAQRARLVQGGRERLALAHALPKQQAQALRVLQAQRQGEGRRGVSAQMVEIARAGGLGEIRGMAQTKIGQAQGAAVLMLGGEILLPQRVVQLVLLVQRLLAGLQVVRLLVQGLLR